MEKSLKCLLNQHISLIGISEVWQNISINKHRSEKTRCCKEENEKKYAFGF